MLCLYRMLVLNVAFFHSDSETGELLIRNHTDSNVGSYVCKVNNAVGRAQCKYALHAYNRKSVISSSNFTPKR